MNWNARIRQIHRWLSLAFTAAVVLNIVCMVLRSPAVWVGFLALVPLIPLLITGLYMFVQPYRAKGRRAAAHS
jgi:hypothetical protein